MLDNILHQQKKKNIFSLNSNFKIHLMLTMLWTYSSRLQSKKAASEKQHRRKCKKSMKYDMYVCIYTIRTKLLGHTL